MRPTIRTITAGAALTAAMLVGGMTAAGPALAATKISHASATSQLSSAGITWSSSGQCSDRYNPTCTSFEQVNQSTVDGIVTLRGSSGCAINITGGTETGHADGTYSHWNGYKVDVTPTTCVENYIYTYFTYIGDRGDGAPMYQSAAGNIYADEGNHWDILYY